MARISWNISRSCSSEYNLAFTTQAVHLAPSLQAETSVNDVVCPLFIYLLVAELLAILVCNDDRIQGIRFGNTEMKITQFADDATCFLASSDSLRHLMNTLDTFASWSGLRVNMNKTKIIAPALLQERESKACPSSTKRKFLDMGRFG